VLALHLYHVGSSQTLQTIVTNGPSSNRLNIVFLSEGYTAAQLGQFAIDATNALNTLLSYHPYQEYRSYINGYAIAVASVESGSDHPSWPQFRNTYFSSTYDSSDRLITIPSNSSGQGKVDSLVQALMPQCQLPVLLVNDLTPGGSDGFDKTAISAIGFAGTAVAQILPHETGHVLANLGDEYTNTFAFPNTEEPNTTQTTNYTGIKWKLWIATNTPLPTPPTSPYANTIGVFEGAHYHMTGWYRPKLNCAMKDKASPFCEVCTEALVLSVYSRVRPIDSFAPASPYLSITNSQTLTFDLSLQQPLTHSLSVQWSTNGVPMNLATNSMLSVPSQLLSPGTNIISAVVHDATTVVRTDPTNLLTQTIPWTVNVYRLQLTNSIWLAGNKFACRFAGNAPQGVVVQTSTNLVTWTPLSTNFLSAGQFWFTNAPAAGETRRFFRGQIL
jgi:hypothetical protein